MAGTFEQDTIEGGIGFARIGTSTVGSQLLSLLTAEEIVPGSPPSYSLCKVIYSYHPMGPAMAEAPITLAQSQEREITISSGPEERLIAAFKKEWESIGGVGANVLIHNAMKTARIYGISTLFMGERGKSLDAPLDLDTLHSADIYFNVLDPLNTAGALVLDQDPTSPDFQKPAALKIAGKPCHLSRAVVMMNEQPVYIEFTNSAFGFVGRSVYQRALFPLKSYVQSMITDDVVIKKVGLLIWKAKSPSSAMSNRIAAMFGWKRANLKSGVSGQVLQIGHEEDIASLNFQNLEGAGRFARENIIKNIATADGMPAGLLNQETLTEGFGEGSEDAKQIARYIDRKRLEMLPLYNFMDRVVQRRAWNPDFYKTLQKELPEYEGVPYQTAFFQWTNGFDARWPNLLIEPESERLQGEKDRFESVVAVVEAAEPLLPDQENKARLAEFLADEVNSRRRLFGSVLDLDPDAIRDYKPPMIGGDGGPGAHHEPDEEGSMTEEPRLPPFDART